MGYLIVIQPIHLTGRCQLLFTGQDLTPSVPRGFAIVLLERLTYQALAVYHPNYQRPLFYRVHRFREHLFLYMRIFSLRCLQVSLMGVAWMTDNLWSRGYGQGLFNHLQVVGWGGLIGYTSQCSFRATLYIAETTTYDQVHRFEVHHSV